MKISFGQTNGIKKVHIFPTGGTGLKSCPKMNILIYVFILKAGQTKLLVG